jgi:hypothetical protein
MEIPGTSNYLPFSYPFLLSFRKFSFSETGEWFIGFILSEFGFSLKEPSFIPFSTLLIISVTFLLVNYTVTILFLNYLSKRVLKNVSTDELQKTMSSHNQKSALVGCCIIYCCLAVIVFTIAVLLQIRASLESQGILQGELLLLRDIINYTVSPMSLSILIIPPLIGAIIIVHRTKDLTIGIRSIKYFSVPILFLNIGMLLDALFELLFIPDFSTWGRFSQVGAAVAFSFLLIPVLISRFISLKLLKMLVRTNFLITVEEL